MISESISISVLIVSVGVIFIIAIFYLFSIAFDRIIVEVKRLLFLVARETSFKKTKVCWEKWKKMEWLSSNEDNDKVSILLGLSSIFACAVTFIALIIGVI